MKATVRNRHSEAYERLRGLARKFQDAVSDKSEALRGGRPPSSRLASSSSNRRARGQVSTRRELTAYEKLLLCRRRALARPKSLRRSTGSNSRKSTASLCGLSRSTLARRPYEVRPCMLALYFLGETSKVFRLVKTSKVFARKHRRCFR